MPGNWFSGRQRRDAAKCGATHSVPLTFLKRKGMLQFPGYMTMRWSMRGNETGSIGVYTSSDCMRLVFRVNGEAVEQAVSWGWTSNKFGPRRWFRCPKCWRNCSALYGGSRFYCRRCWRLTYHSQYAEAWERLSDKAERLRNRLGGHGPISAGDPFIAPPKPKWMRWKTYDAICDEGERLCDRYAMAFEVRCAALFSRLKRKGVQL